MSDNGPISMKAAPVKEVEEDSTGQTETACTPAIAAGSDLLTDTGSVVSDISMSKRWKRNRVGTLLAH